jgi:hypothetical protein
VGARSRRAHPLGDETDEAGLGTNGLNPLALGAYAMSQPAWDVKRKSIWYTDGNSGFYVVKLAGGVQKLLARR